MKRITLIMALALGLLTSCEKEPLIHPEPEKKDFPHDKYGHPNDWIDPNKDIKIHDYVTGNKQLD